MGLTVAVKNATLDGLGITHVSLHTADPGEDGSNEVVGGSPAYARKAVTVPSAVNGEIHWTGLIVFDIPGGGTTVSYAGFWTASSGGVMKASMPIVDESFGAQGIWDCDEFSLDLNK